MAPKRGSKQFTATREKYQLDPQERHLHDMEVTPVPCGTGGKYRLAVNDSTDNIHTLEDLKEELQTAGISQVKIFESQLDALLEVIPKFIAKNGHSVRIGNLLVVKPYVTGSINHANDALDPAKNRLEIRATISPAMRHALAKVKVVNVNHGRSIIEFAINDSNTAKRDVIDFQYPILVHGKGICVSAQSATDEDTRGRVWVETLDGEMLGRCAVSSSGPNLTVATFTPEKPVEADEVRIVMETYGTQEAAEAGDKSKLARCSHVVKLFKAV